jgi:dynein heavy chain 1
MRVNLEWLKAEAPESAVPSDVRAALGPSHEAIAALKVLAIVRKHRPDRVVPAIKCFVRAAIDQDLDALRSFSLSLADSHTPVLLCAHPGHDPGRFVEASATGSLESVAVGAADSYSTIEKATQGAADRGDWILVRNVHLSPIWTSKYITFLSNLKPNPNFRVFMTAEITPRLGADVFRASRVVVQEGMVGARSTLKRILEQGLGVPPGSHPKLIGQFLSLHAALTERLRYAPLGWTKAYEFNDADLRFATQIALRWVDSAAAGRQVVSDEIMPWNALRCLVSVSAYGGKVDSVVDQRILTAISEILLAPGAKFGDLSSYVENIPQGDNPEDFWLPKDSGKFMFTRMGEEVLGHILAVRAFKSGLRDTGGEFVRDLVEKWGQRLERLQWPRFSPGRDSLIALALADEIASLQSTC